MSLQLLKDLNGQKSGKLNHLINSLCDQPKIAWYPSAGEDFRALLYLHDNFTKIAPSDRAEPKMPDIFLFTDYYPWQHSTFLDRAKIYNDGRTTIEVKHIEELPQLHLPMHSELVHFPEGSTATDRAVFMNVKVSSDKLGTYSFPVIYAFAENESFFCNKIIPSNATLSHILHIRYGGGCGGGGNASGAWLLHILNIVRCQVFVTDDHHYWQSGDEFTLTLCSAINRNNVSKLTPIRQIESQGWSNHGDVTWYLVD